MAGHEHSDSPHGDTGAFADHVLLAVLRSPADPRSPLVLRTAATLIQSLATEGAVEEVTAFLAPEPGGDATFGVVVTGDGVVSNPQTSSGPVGPTQPTDLAANGPGDSDEHGDTPGPIEGLDVASALGEAGRIASVSSSPIEVISVAPDGLRRRVLGRSVDGPFLFVFPSADAFEGDGDHIQSAVAKWKAVLDAPPEVAPVGLLDLESAVRSAMADLAVEVDMHAVESVVRDAMSEATVGVDVEAIREVFRDGGPAQPFPIDRITEAVRDAIRTTLADQTSLALQEAMKTGEADVARGSDLVAVENAVREAHVDLIQKARQYDETTRTGFAEVAGRSDVTSLGDAIQGVLRDIGAKLDELMVEGLAPTLSGESGGDGSASHAGEDEESISRYMRAAVAGLASRSDLVDLESSVADAMQKVVRQVAAESPRLDGPTMVDHIVNRLSMIIRSRPEERVSADYMPGGWVAQATLMSAADQLHIQLEAFNDRIRAGTRSLESLADELATRERNAASLSDHLAKSVDSSLTRLANQLDHRMEQLNRPGPEPTDTVLRNEMKSVAGRLSELLDRLAGQAGE